MSNLLKITVTSTDNTRCARAIFTWSEDLQDCNLTAYGFGDEEIDAMLAAKVHEGADLDGYNVAVA